MGGAGESRNDEIRTDYPYVIELSMKKTSDALGWLGLGPGGRHQASPRSAPSGSLSGVHTLIGGEKRAFSPVMIRKRRVRWPGSLKWLRIRVKGVMEKGEF